MLKESLFELIRKEEVIVWAGAGMSLYANYPSGKRLGEILIEKLTPKERESIDLNLPLPNLSEEFYRLKGNNKNGLIKILTEIFSKKAESTDTHNTLASIPHFKTIITTNYDTLFEDAYKNNAQVIYNTRHIPYIDSKKTQIFKVHGDLNDPDSIIITKSDYDNFFKDNRDNGTYWSVIRERLATNNVLFLGYNIDDPNISVIFDRITDSLGENRRESFFVAPKLAQHKVNALTKKGIHYIDSTAEILISELLTHIKEHIISDIESGKTSSDTFRLFLANNDLLPSLKADKDSYQVTSLTGTKKDIHGTANFTFKNEKKFIKELKDFTQGRKFGTFEVPEDILLNANFWYGGVKFPHSEGILKLEFKSNPKIESKIDVKFEDDFEFTNIPIKLYGSPSLIEIHLELDSAQIIVTVNIETTPEIKADLKYKHKEICKNTKSEIELFTFLRKISNSETFTVYNESGDLFTKAFSKSTKLLEQSNFFLNYFTSLRKIENYYGIRFSNIHINDINESSTKTVEYIVSILENEYIILDWDEELTMTLIDNYSDEIVQQFEDVNKASAPVVAQDKTEQILALHGKEINLGYKKVEFQNMFITNFKDILERKNNIVKLKSRSKKIHISFTKHTD